MGIVPFDDHPSVLLQLRGVEDLEQGLGHPLDQSRLEIRGQPALEQLHANERHLRGRCRLRHAFHCAGNEAPASGGLLPERAPARIALWEPDALGEHHPARVALVWASVGDDA